MPGHANTPANILDRVLLDLGSGWASDPSSAKARLEHWWPVDREWHERQGTHPGEEVALGAVLVQNTSWQQVERAIERLRAADLLGLERLVEVPVERLAELVRPAGFVARKPLTLKHLATWYRALGGSVVLEAMIADDPDPVREDLLDIHGIGPETADAILLFGFDAPVFVVDAYKRRLMGRLGDLESDAPGPRADYATVARWWRRGVPASSAGHRLTHAAITTFMQTRCRPEPRCPGCALLSTCRHGTQRVGEAASAPAEARTKRSPHDNA